MRTSEFGIRFIHGEESFVDHVYLDQVGRRSIGWGHLIQAGEAYSRITLAEGNALFKRDLSVVEGHVEASITYPSTQRQFDMIVSLAFNIGGPRLAASRLRRVLNRGEIGTAKRVDGRTVYTGAMLEWSEFRMGEVDGELVILPVLVRRRAREIAIFLEEHRRRDVDPATAPDMRDPTLSEIRFGDPPDDDPPPDAA